MALDLFAKPNLKLGMGRPQPLEMMRSSPGMANTESNMGEAVAMRCTCPSAEAHPMGVA